MNNEIIQEGKNGFLANTPEDWLTKLTQLIESPELRRSLGASGRESVVKRYSVEANKEKYLRLFV